MDFLQFAISVTIQEGEKIACCLLCDTTFKSLKAFNFKRHFTNIHNGEFINQDGSPVDVLVS